LPAAGSTETAWKTLATEHAELLQENQVIAVAIETKAEQRAVIVSSTPVHLSKRNQVIAEAFEKAKEDLSQLREKFAALQSENDSLHAQLEALQALQAQYNKVSHGVDAEQMLHRGHLCVSAAADLSLCKLASALSHSLSRCAGWTGFCSKGQVGHG